ncbi:MAG: hypothetical protein V4649_10325 [Bacteroidota bacterium]
MVRALKMLFVLLLCMCWYNVAVAQELPVYISRDTTKILTKDAIVNDIGEFAETVAGSHIEPFSQISKRRFFRAVRDVKDSAEIYNVDELLVRLLQVSASLGDEHTNIYYSGRDIFPLEFHWFEEGIHVTRTDEQYTQVLYARLLAINGIPIGEVVDRLRTVISDTNTAAVVLATPRYLTDPYVLHGLHVLPGRTGVVYTLLTLRNDTVTVHPQAIDRRRAKLHRGFDNNYFLRNRGQGNYWFKYSDTGNFVYFNYSRCEDQDKEHTFAEFRKQLENAIAEKKPGKIVIDLRQNRGGNSKLVVPFIDYLQRSLLNEKGHIYVLIGKGTFSAAILNAGELKNRTAAITVGEYTAGSVQHYGSIKRFVLPATKMTASYSTKYHVVEDKYTGSLRPDVFIANWLADYSRGVDAALEYAISH